MRDQSCRQGRFARTWRARDADAMCVAETAVQRVQHCAEIRTLVFDKRDHTRQRDAPAGREIAQELFDGGSHGRKVTRAAGIRQFRSGCSTQRVPSVAL
jgi:hypothetical protein